MKNILSAVALIAAAAAGGVSNAAPISYSFIGTISVDTNGGSNFPPTNPDWLGDTITGTLAMDFDAAEFVDASQAGYFVAYTVSAPPPSWLRISITNPDGSSFISDSFGDLNTSASFSLQNAQDNDHFDEFFVLSDQQSLSGNRDQSAILLLRTWLSASSPSLTDSADPATVIVRPSEADMENYGFVSSLSNNDPATQYSYNFTINSVALDIAPIPEPSTYALMLAGLGLCGWAARRQRPSPKA